MPRHAQSSHASHRRGSRAGAPRRRRRRGPRVLFAVCCTALAAGAGGVLSGVLPLPPGVPASVVVAGDPAAGRTPVVHRGTAISTAAGPAYNGGAAAGAAAPGARAGSSGSPSARPSPTPTATPGATHSATATASPSATASQPPTTTAPTRQNAAVVATDQAQILDLVNIQRAKAGCKALTASTPLNTLAQNFSQEMAVRNFFDHTDPDGKSPWDRAKALGITDLGGENIAMGQQTPDDVMTAWMNSAGHRANILNCTYHSLGVGVYYAATGGPWWTQDFGF
ncbi:CAP domain-containing protein [Streptacidiphilus cavernicola]|uniref:CAP domain-containing protein n=1 Tax=Streptacidiphilus cavernicola TaxID=3342716 RepID=A0ABV6W367_9ACTN